VLDLRRQFDSSDRDENAIAAAKPMETRSFSALYLATVALLLVAPCGATAQTMSAIDAVAAHCGHPDGCQGGGGGAQQIPSTGPASCVGGVAAGFPCNNIDLGYWLDIDDIGGGEGNDIWGWTDPLSQDEYALMGRTNGTAFVDVTDPQNPVYLGNLPTHDVNDIWRDVKVYDDHAFIVSESATHGLQIFDLTQLASVVAPPVTFSETFHDAGFGNAHNIAINEATGYAYVVGSDQCSGGLLMYDVSTPAAVSVAGCFNADGYTHDVQCISYAGPDGDYAGAEICFASNEDSLTIVDVSNKLAPVQVSKTDYAGREYTHQSWVTDDHAWLLQDDEGDELESGHNTRTYIVDITDLDAPSFDGFYTSHLPVIDHNQYVVGDYSFQANYAGGLRVLDLSSIALGALCEVASFDTFPTSDGPNFNGAWSNYPYFASGTVVVSTNIGLAVLEPNHVGASCLAMPPVAQTTKQQACMVAANKAGAKVAKAQGKLGAKCIGAATKGDPADAQLCLTLDERGKVAKATGKVATTLARKCAGLGVPDFGLTESATISAAAVDEQLALIANLFGSDLNLSINDSSVDPDAAKCQASLAKSHDRAVQARLKEFLVCKKAGLKVGSIGNTVGLADCLDTVTEDSRGKIAKAAGKITTTLAGTCSGVSSAISVPGDCGSAGDVAACVDERAACRMCMMVAKMDGLVLDCDDFDDQTANSSCIP
jgi:choice-of-anchor B domain-containing protein